MELQTGRDWEDRLQDEGTWQRVKGKIRETWGDLTDDDMEKARGNFDQFAGRVKEKTGETAEDIQRKFAEWTS
ncbi:MAG TPA: CsbD family protein [Acidimicrobiia bacterium]|nr:CsbD family protein [Acidimicrobiia bacterium]